MYVESSNNMVGTVNLYKTFQQIFEVWEHTETQNLEKFIFLPISYNITISWLSPLNSSWFIFLLHDSENHLLSLADKVMGKRLLIGSLMRRQILQHRLVKH